MQKTCQWCNQGFVTEHQDQRYCSKVCQGRARENRRKSRIRRPRVRGTVPVGVVSEVKLCKWCGESFLGVLTAEYCSNRCWNREKRRRRREAGKPLGNSRESRKAQKQKNKSAARDFVYFDKITRGCFGCPERRPYALDYHHLDRTSKRDCVSALVNKGVSMFVIKNEIEKCILLCRNCHAVKERGDGYRDETQLTTRQVCILQIVPTSVKDDLFDEYNLEDAKFPVGLYPKDWLSGFDAAEQTRLRAQNRI